MNKEQKYYTDRSVTRLYSESTGEYVLPDYNTDIKKVLLVKARAIPSGSFVNSESAELSGIVSFDLVDVDADGEIQGCSFTTDYDIAVKCKKDSCQSVEARTRVTGATLRVLGPRRVTAKACLESNVHLIEEMELGIDGDSFDSREPEVIERVAMVAGTSWAVPKERELAEAMGLIEGAMADEVDIIATDSAVRIISSEISGDSVNIKGEATVSALVRSGDGEPTLYTTVIPFMEELSLEGEVKDGVYHTTACPSSVTVVKEPCDEGVNLVGGIILDLAASVGYNTPVTYIQDCYLTDREVDNEYEDFVYSELIGSAYSSLDIEEKIDADTAGLTDFSKILMPVCEIRLDSVNAVAGGASISGNIRFSGIACQENGDNPPSYAPVKIDVPFEQNVNINSQISDNAVIECDLSCHSAAVTLDGGAVNLSLCLSCFASAFRQESVRRLSRSCTGDEIEASSGAVITVYYPDRNESLFEIAKRYHVSVMSLAADNALSEEVVLDNCDPLSLRGIDRLIIHK